MSSFKKRQKTLKRAHKERSQLHSRQHLGLLEKHKDYVLRARNYQKKKLQLKRLHEKARNRNPDEFYYKMVSQPLQGGRHVIKPKEEKYSEDELLLMNTQHHKYVQMKLTQEAKKVDRLRSCLQTGKSNTHTIYVDSQEEVTLKAADLQQERTEGPASEILTKDTNTSSHLYKELKARSKRCQDLQRVCSKLKTERDLMGKGTCVKIKSTDGSTPPTYKWKMERLK